jgi:hypothetical protein
MRSYYYPSGRLAIAAMFLGLLAFATGSWWYNDGGGPLLVFTLVMVFGCVKLTLDAMSRDPALKFDQHTIWIKKTWGGVAEVPWREVHDISAKVLTWRYMGVVPVSKTTYITVTCEGGLTGARRLRVSTSALGLSVTQTAELLLLLKKAHLDVVGETGVAMAAAGKHGWGIAPSKSADGPEESSAFDPDAAIARYMASKQAGSQPGAATPAAAVPPPVPQRPVFGRRVG